jgi:hypothetical protein
MSDSFMLAYVQEIFRILISNQYYFLHTISNYIPIYKESPVTVIKFKNKYDHTVSNYHFL